MSSSNPIPFSEPAWLNGFPSAYHTDSHRRWQKAVRAFVEEHLLPNAFEWDEAGELPEHVFATFAKHGMLLPALPAPLPIEWLKKLGVHDILGVQVEEFDYIHGAIFADEVR